MSRLDDAHLERFGRWLNAACEREVPAEPGPLHAYMTASLKMNVSQRRELVQMLVAAIEERLPNAHERP